jgi:hypothetical protein
LLRQKKVTKEKATPTFALILWCSQRAGPAQIARWRANRAQWAHGAGLRPRVAPLLGVEYTGTPSNVFLIASRLGLQEPGCEHPGYATATIAIMVPTL